MMQHVAKFIPHNYYLFDVIIMATREVIYRKRQGNGIPNILHVKRISYNQMIKEKVLIYIYFIDCMQIQKKYIRNQKINKINIYTKCFKCVVFLRKICWLVQEQDKVKTY